jgi:hypothetical protein
MRASRRFEGHVWLKALPDDRPGTPIVIAAACRPHFASNVDYLTNNLGLYLLFEYGDQHYTLRCYPNGDPEKVTKPGFAAAYRGPILAALPSAAVDDYLMWQRRPEAAELSAREVIRWVG